MSGAGSVQKRLFLAVKGVGENKAKSNAAKVANQSKLTNVKEGGVVYAKREVHRSQS